MTTVEPQTGGETRTRKSSCNCGQLSLTYDGPDPERIADLIKTFEPTGVHQELFGDGAAHAKIVGGLMRRYAR